MPEITFAGLRATYQVWGGAGEPIVLLHSGGELRRTVGECRTKPS